MRTSAVDAVRRSFGYKFPRLGGAANSIFFKLAPRYIDSELFPGIRIRLDVTDLTQRTTYWQGDRFEYPTAQVLSNWAGHGVTTFFDIGSNYGFFSYYMLSRRKGIKVHSFEPNPDSFQIIQKTKTENQLDDLYPNQIGLSDKEEILHLHQAPSDTGHSTFGDHPELREGRTVPVPVMPFDTWLEHKGIALPSTPAWIAKIDVEGFEPRVLQGMKNALAHRAFAGLVVEINPFTLDFVKSSPDEVFHLMETLGYRLMQGTEPDRNGNAFFVPAEPA
jgi:FkbM family methyltransferase